MKRELTKQDKNFNKEKFNEWVKQFINEWGHQWGFGFYIKTTNNEVIYQGTNEFKQWRDGKLEEYINNKMSSKEQNKPLQQPLVNSSLPTEEQVLQTILRQSQNGDSVILCVIRNFGSESKIDKSYEVYREQVVKVTKDNWNAQKKLKQFRKEILANDTIL